MRALEPLLVRFAPLPERDEPALRVEPDLAALRVEPDLAALRVEPDFAALRVERVFAPDELALALLFDADPLDDRLFACLLPDVLLLAATAHPSLI